MKTTIAFLLLFGVAMGEVEKRQVAYRQNIPRYQPGPSVPHGFRASAPVDEESEEVIDRNSVSPTQHSYVNRPQQSVQFRPQDARSRPQEYSGYQQGRRPQNKQNLKEEELEEEEKEEPDRLTMLLPQSKFSCEGKNTGYYADDGLGCEVFHYCQDNARHSWICPEGFLFHQVHLICMPSSDNICTQSSQYHFVNDYLYKPINEAEVLSKPNVTLRYSDRYYPENYYEEDAHSPPAPSPSPRPRPVIQHQQPIYQAPRPVPQQILRQPNQVFHSPEEVNIPLQHRRPVPSQHPLRSYQQSSEEYEY